MTTHLRVAIADDEPDMREYLQRLLPRLGHQVVASATSGAELIATVDDTHPDLIITDVRMPGMDGDAALEQIWAKSLIPAIVISAYDRPSSLTTEHSMSPVTYINKPFKWTDLKAAIEFVFSRASESGDHKDS